ncbi:sce7726 family protein [Parvicella tangerina]|uniref:sce7726 family protein n=1 Tax=Parvicella tangerina TaxID=2829795 RepID=UPI00215BB6A2|nr:sce7726 family protein [Parvicella tangerina]
MRRILNKNYSFTDYRIKKNSDVFTGAVTKRDVFEQVYQILQEQYYGEYLYKNALLNKILIERHDITKTCALNEFKVSNSIADYVLLNGNATIYEIKTDLDTLAKLDKQLHDYSKFAEKVYIVSHSKFIKTLLSRYENSHVGIIEMYNRDSLNVVKESVANYDNLSHDTLFRVLRKREYLSIVEDIYGFVPDVPNTKIFRSCYELIKDLDVELFQSHVIETLKERNISSPELLTSRATPYEWRQLCYSLDLKHGEYETFYQYLNRQA